MEKFKKFYRALVALPNLADRIRVAEDTVLKVIEDARDAANDASHANDSAEDFASNAEQYKDDADRYCSDAEDYRDSAEGYKDEAEDARDEARELYAKVEKAIATASDGKVVLIMTEEELNAKIAHAIERTRLVATQ